MFSKMLQQLSIADAGEAMAKMGFDGVDLTVREKGHVLPENVVADLPAAVETLRDKGLVVGMLTTGVTSADQPYSEETFATAAECGVKYLKLGYWTYEGFGTLRDSMAKVRADLEGLEALALKHGVNATIHTHSGNFLTADLPICHMLTDGLDPDAIGIYIDAGHIVLEGGYGVWKQGLDLVSDRIRLIAAKTLGWFPETNGNGRVKWTRKVLPFEKGMTDWQEFFGYIKQTGFDGFVSIHSEYNDLSLEALIAQTESDFAFMKAAIAAVDQP